MANQPNNETRRRSKKGHSTPPKKKSRVGSILLKVFIGLFFVGCVAFLSGIGLFWYYAKDAPALDDSQLESANSIQFFAANGELFQDYGSEKREVISPTEIPKQLEDAIVSVEDKRFYKHIGVDPIRIVGSAVSNLLNGGKQGGSTLTQQLIKLSFFSTSSEDQNLKRKAQEAVLAVELEQEKSKQEILTYYINKVYMSNGVYGMETAAETFYGKTLSELSLAQTALVAGLPNAPNYYDPYVNKDAAKSRRDTVLMTMLDNDKISKQEYDEAIATPIDDGLQEIKKENDDWAIYDNYLTEVLKEVEEKKGKDIYKEGIDIYTNIDLDAQKRLYDIVNSDQYVQYPDDNMQVAATLIEADSGKVAAQIGRRNVEEGTMFGENLAVNTRRDFGSTVKPITDYAPAIEYLNYSTAKTVVDAPYNYKGTNIAVNNWDNQYMGAMSIRQALVLSRNTTAVKTFEEVGPENVSKFLEGLDIHYDPIASANAISSNSDKQEGTKYGISSLKMAAAYAAFANGGTYHKPQYVNKIVYQDGTEDADSFRSEGKRAMKETTAYMITDILKGVITSGTGTNAAIPGLYQAGKTGTSNYTDDELAKIGYNVNSPSPDSNFVGYTPTYSMAVWTGYTDKLEPVTSESSMVASEVYKALMQFVSSSIANEDWQMPDGLVRIGNELYLEGYYDMPVESSYSEPAQEPSSSESSASSESSTKESSVEESSSSESSSSSSESETTPEEEPEESSEQPSQPSSSEEQPPSSSSENTSQPDPPATSTTED
uniref:PBP1A family penicillin-binding protein n=1 Tax=Candidatus Enterococcus willemsii TaxID=1857215 RepID=UPI00403F8288